MLRDHARQAGDSHLADEIEQTLLVNKFKHGDEHDKLLLSQSDRVAFQHILYTALYQQYWRPITEFVPHYLMRSGAFVKQSEVYITLKNRVTPGDMLAALADLATFARYWREVLSTTLETLASAEPTKFAKLLDQFPTYIAASAQAFRSLKPLCSGYFIETNLGATSIHRFCQRVVAAMDLPPEAWSVTIKPATLTVTP